MAKIKRTRRSRVSHEYILQDYTHRTEIERSKLEHILGDPAFQKSMPTSTTPTEKSRLLFRKNNINSGYAVNSFFVAIR